MKKPGACKALLSHIALRISLQTGMLAAKAVMQDRPYKAQALLFLNKRCWSLWHALR